MLRWGFVALLRGGDKSDARDEMREARDEMRDALPQMILAMCVWRKNRHWNQDL
jgi:hypothetical protein